MKIKKLKHRGVIVKGSSFESGFLLLNDIVDLAPPPFQHMRGIKLKDLLKECKKKKWAWTSIPPISDFKFNHKKDSFRNLEEKIARLEKELSYVHMASLSSDNNNIPVDSNEVSVVYNEVFNLRKKYNSLYGAFVDISSAIRSVK